MINSNSFFNRAFEFDKKNMLQDALDSYLYSICSEEISIKDSYLNALGILIHYVFDNGATYDQLKIPFDEASILLYNLSDKSILLDENKELLFLNYYIKNYYADKSQEEDEVDKKQLDKWLSEEPSNSFGYVIYETCFPNTLLDEKGKMIEKFIDSTQKKPTVLNKYFKSLVE